MMNGGIYQIINKVTGKFYVGRSMNVYSRMKGHKRRLKRDAHRDKNGIRTHLQNAWNKYGEGAFIFQPIDFFETKEEQILAEQEVIDTFWESGLLYNKSNSANSGTGPCSEETKRKISKKLKGRTLPEEQKQKIRKSNIGKNKGKKHTKEARRKISEFQNGKSKRRHICPHCGFEGGGGAMKRWHFDNCKVKNDN